MLREVADWPTAISCPAYPCFDLVISGYEWVAVVCANLRFVANRTDQGMGRRTREGEGKRWGKEERRGKI